MFISRPGPALTPRKRKRALASGGLPNDRASPPLHTPLQLVSSFCCFPTTVYMQAGSLSIFWAQHSRPSCALPFCYVYQLGLCRFTALPPSPCFTGRVSRHHHMIRGSPSFAVCVIYSSLQCPFLLSIIIKKNLMIPLDLAFLITPVLLVLIFSSSPYEGHVCHNRKVPICWRWSF